MTSTDVQPFTPKPFYNRTKIYVHIKLGRGVALTCAQFPKLMQNSCGRSSLLRCRLITLIASNKKQLDKLKETWSAVSGCAQIRLLSSPSFHRDRKCAWGMLRQPCLNYSLTLWPVSRIDTAATATCCGAVQRGRHGITLVGGGGGEI